MMLSHVNATLTSGVSLQGDSNMEILCFCTVSRTNLLNNCSIYPWFGNPQRSFDVDVISRDTYNDEKINHYIDVKMTTMTCQLTSLTVVYSTVYSDANQRKHQSSASLAFVWGFHRDRWIPRTKGQLRGKSFHLMTSPCVWFISVSYYLAVIFRMTLG